MKKINWAKDQEAAGGFGNTILYRMVKENLHHETPAVTKGKIGIIGRVYAAAVNRGAGERNQENANLDKKLIDHLAKKIKRRHVAVDECIGECRKIKRVSYENIRYIIETHSFLNAIIVDGINEWREYNGREVKDRSSFTSKYLHFHAPMAFFILDGIVEKELNTKLSKLNKKSSHKVISWPDDCKEKHHTRYGKHCIKMLEYASIKYEKHDWNPRLIDGHLMGYISRRHALGQPKK